MTKKEYKEMLRLFKKTNRTEEEDLRLDELIELVDEDTPDEEEEEEEEKENWKKENTEPIPIEVPKPPEFLREPEVPMEPEAEEITEPPKSEKKKRKNYFW